MSALTHRKPSIVAVILLVVGLLPAGQAWLQLVALPALAFETSHAIRLYMSEERRAILAKQREIARSGTPFERSTLALVLILGGRR